MHIYEFVLTKEEMPKNAPQYFFVATNILSTGTSVEGWFNGEADLARYLIKKYDQNSSIKINCSHKSLNRNNLPIDLEKLIKPFFEEVEISK